MIGKILCWLGFHNEVATSDLYVGTHVIIIGLECSRCGKKLPSYIL